MRGFLLFDHDGVLVDTERWYFAATRDSLRRLGIELDSPTYLALMGEGRPSWELARARGISEEVITQLKSERDFCYQHYLSREAIEIEGVVEVLAELRKSCRMAIVTTSKRADFDLIHRSRRIASFFDFVISIEDCVRAKPDPDPYQRGLARFGIRPDQAVAIEDSSRGLKSARAAGLDCIVIRNDFTAAQDFAGAIRIVNSIRELPAALTDIG